MRPPNLLNPQLYEALCNEFGGARRVKAERAGDPGKFAYTVVDGRLVLDRQLKGEEYRINCPFCGDTTKRLSISYRWGTYDEKTQSRNLYLAHCYNEDCLSVGNRRGILYERVFLLQHVGTPPNAVEQWNAAVSNRKPGQVIQPGPLWKVSTLERKDPSHHAVQYLQRRLLSPQYLGETWGVGYCPSSFMNIVSGRLVVPVWFKGKNRGWSARTLDDEEKPKWYHMPDMPRDELLYNFDQMVTSPTKVLVEGPIDVYGVGSMSGGIFGKLITLGQCKILRECVQSEDVVILMLDPKKAKDDEQRDREHHMLRSLELLRQERFADRVVPVWLPEQLDPGDADRAFLFRLMRRVAAEHGFPDLYLRD